MTAAKISPTYVQFFDMGPGFSTGDGSAGASRHMKCLYLEGAKETQNDWFLLTDYLSTAESTQIAGWHVIREASGNAYAIDVATYDSDDGKFDLTEGTAGTVHAWIYFYE